MRKPAYPSTASISQRWERERPDLDHAINSPTIYVLALARIVEDDFDRICRARFGMNANDMRVLLALRRAGAPFRMRPTDLFHSLLVTAGAITKQVDRLGNLGMTARVVDPRNSRGFLVELTAVGMRTADDAALMISQDTIIAQALRELSAQELGAGWEFLTRVVNRVEQLQGPVRAEASEG